MRSKKGNKKRGSKSSQQSSPVSPRKQPPGIVRRVGRPSKLSSDSEQPQPLSNNEKDETGLQTRRSPLKSSSNAQTWTPKPSATGDDNRASSSKPRGRMSVEQSPEQSTSMHDSSDQELNLHDPRGYRPLSLHSGCEDDSAVHVNSSTLQPNHSQSDSHNNIDERSDLHSPYSVHNTSGGGDGSGIGDSKLPRKLSKREKKALIKPTKRTRTVLDVRYVAKMDELSEQFQNFCCIDLNGSGEPRRVPVAGNVLVHPVPSSPTLPRGGRRARGRGSRGSRGGRGSAMSSTIPQPPQLLVSSWSPLCLPRMEHLDTFDGLFPLKSPSPRLKYLSQHCVRHFLHAIESILSSHTRSSLSHSQPLFTHANPSNNMASKEDHVNGCYRTPQPPNTLSSIGVYSPQLPTTHLHSLSMYTAESIARLQASTAAAVVELPPQSSSSSSTTLEASQVNGVVRLQPDTHQTNSNRPGRPPKRGGGRGRPPRKPTSPFKLMQTETAGEQTSPMGAFSDVLTAQPLVNKTNPLNKAHRPPRELRDLVTWPAMMAAAAAASRHPDPSPDSANPLLRPLSLQIVGGVIDDSDEGWSGPNSSNPHHQPVTRRSRRASSGQLAGSSGASAATRHPQPQTSEADTESFTSGSEIDIKNATASTADETHPDFSLTEHSPTAVEASTHLPIQNTKEVATIDLDEPSEVFVSLNVSSSTKSKRGRKRKSCESAPPLELRLISPSVLQHKEMNNDQSTTISTPKQLSTVYDPKLSPNILPPRKRYRPSLGDEEDGEVVEPSVEMSVDDSSSASAISTSASRGKSRGRGGRRSSGYIHAERVVECSGFASILDHLPITPSRPKREAAAMGYATLVHASLNSSPMRVEQLSEHHSNKTISPSIRLGADSPAIESAMTGSSHIHYEVLPLKPSSTSMMPTPSDSQDATVNKKPRGRPPKNRTPTPAYYKIENLTTDSNEAEVKISPVDHLLADPQIGESVFSPVEKKADLSTDVGGKFKGGKRGRRPTIKSSPPPIKRKLEQDTFNVMDETMVIRSSCLFLLRAHTKCGRRKDARRDEDVNVRSCCGSDQLGMVQFPSSTQALLAGPIAELPRRNLAFLLSEISSPFPLYLTDGADGVALFYIRFLNTCVDADCPNGADARLVAPFLSLPNPIRQADFYRYLCSSGLLSNYEACFNGRLSPKVLATVCPCFVINSGDDARYTSLPFASPEYPPLCLTSITPELLNREVQAEGFQQLDLLMEFLLRSWEAFVGRRSWMGKRLIQIRARYTALRIELADNDKAIPLPSDGISGVGKVSGPICAGSGVIRKKIDRQTLERGAEVIRCLCGFRVEGGHVMVQCNMCSTWQHLPCLWWALSLDMQPRLAAPTTSDSTFLSNWLGGNQSDEGIKRPPNDAWMQKCRAALVSALNAGGHDVSKLVLFDDNSLKGALADADKPYFCPICLEIDGLTKDYPRTLAASLAVHDVAAVLPPGQSCYDYWSLGSGDGCDQYLTDEFAIIHRDDFTAALGAPNCTLLVTSISKIRPPMCTALDVIVLRIYRLWKDAKGVSWMEGGAFLRPYDMPEPVTDPTPSTRLWHSRELVYDEVSRVILPLALCRGRCSVLNPNIYRLGRPSDLPALVLPSATSTDAVTYPQNVHPLVFLCDHIFTRPVEVGVPLNLKEIAPSYLKVGMKPYAFLRHTESSSLRAPIVRQSTAAELRTLDASTQFGEIWSVRLDGLYSRGSGRQISQKRVAASVETVTPTIEIPRSVSQTQPKQQKKTIESALNRLQIIHERQLPSVSVPHHFHHGSRKPLRSLVNKTKHEQQNFDVMPSIQQHQQRGTPVRRGRPPKVASLPLSIPVVAKTLTFSELQEEMAKKVKMKAVTDALTIDTGEHLQTPSYTAVTPHFSPISPASTATSTSTSGPRKRGRKPSSLHALPHMTTMDKEDHSLTTPVKRGRKPKSLPLNASIELDIMESVEEQKGATVRPTPDEDSKYRDSEIPSKKESKLLINETEISLLDKTLEVEVCVPMQIEKSPRKECQKSVSPNSRSIQAKGISSEPEVDKSNKPCEQPILRSEISTTVNFVGEQSNLKLDESGKRKRGRKPLSPHSMFISSVTDQKNIYTDPFPAASDELIGQKPNEETDSVKLFEVKDNDTQGEVVKISKEEVIIQDGNHCIFVDKIDNSKPCLSPTLRVRAQKSTILSTTLSQEGSADDPLKPTGRRSVQLPHPMPDDNIQRRISRRKSTSDGDEAKLPLSTGRKTSDICKSPQALSPLKSPGRKASDLCETLQALNPLKSPSRKASDLCESPQPLSPLRSSGRKESDVCESPQPLSPRRSPGRKTMLLTPSTSSYEVVIRRSRRSVLDEGEVQNSTLGKKLNCVSSKSFSAVMEESVPLVENLSKKKSRSSVSSPSSNFVEESSVNEPLSLVQSPLKQKVKGLVSSPPNTISTNENVFNVESLEADLSSVRIPDSSSPHFTFMENISPTVAASEEHVRSNGKNVVSCDEPMKTDSSFKAVLPLLGYDHIIHSPTQSRIFDDTASLSDEKNSHSEIKFDAVASDVVPNSKQKQIFKSASFLATVDKTISAHVPLETQAEFSTSSINCSIVVNPKTYIDTTTSLPLVFTSFEAPSKDLMPPSHTQKRNTKTDSTSPGTTFVFEATEDPVSHSPKKRKDRNTISLQAAFEIESEQTLSSTPHRLAEELIADFAEEIVDEMSVSDVPSLETVSFSLVHETSSESYQKSNFMSLVKAPEVESSVANLQFLIEKDEFTTLELLQVSCDSVLHTSSLSAHTADSFQPSILSRPCLVHSSPIAEEKDGDRNMTVALDSPSPELAIIHDEAINPVGSNSNNNNNNPTLTVHGIYIASPAIGLLREEEDENQAESSLKTTVVDSITTLKVTMVDPLIIYTKPESALVSSVFSRRLSDAYQPISPASSDDASINCNNEEEEEEEPIVDVVGCSDSDREIKPGDDESALQHRLKSLQPPIAGVSCATGNIESPPRSDSSSCSNDVTDEVGNSRSRCSPDATGVEPTRSSSLSSSSTNRRKGSGPKRIVVIPPPMPISVVRGESDDHVLDLSTTTTTTQPSVD